MVKEFLNKSSFYRKQIIESHSVNGNCLYLINRTQESDIFLEYSDWWSALHGIATNSVTE
jgi:hypothetical protein